MSVIWRADASDEQRNETGAEALLLEKVFYCGQDIYALNMLIRGEKYKVASLSIAPGELVVARKAGLSVLMMDPASPDPVTAPPVTLILEAAEMCSFFVRQLASLIRQQAEGQR